MWKLTLVFSTLVAIVVVTFVVSLPAFFIYKAFSQPNPPTTAERYATKRDECIKNGFDYEIVDDFWYAGVRCTKVNR